MGISLDKTLFSYKEGGRRERRKGGGGLRAFPQRLFLRLLILEENWLVSMGKDEIHRSIKHDKTKSVGTVLVPWSRHE